MLKNIRHKIVKLIAPKVYTQSQRYQQQVTRPMFNTIATNNKTSLLGAEIGTHTGNNALRILKQLDIHLLYLIDPYIVYMDRNCSINRANKEVEARQLLQPYEQHTVFIKKTSNEACVEFTDNLLDFVYIDGNHNYEYVKADIENYYPKVKRGGFIGGHDFYGNYPDVVKAVTEFAAAHSLTLHTEEHDWWFIKPN